MRQIKHPQLPHPIFLRHCSLGDPLLGPALAWWQVWMTTPFWVHILHTDPSHPHSTVGAQVSSFYHFLLFCKLPVQSYLKLCAGPFWLRGLQETVIFFSELSLLRLLQPSNPIFREKMIIMYLFFVLLFVCL